MFSPLKLCASITAASVSSLPHSTMRLVAVNQVRYKDLDQSRQVLLPAILLLSSFLSYLTTDWPDALDASFVPGKSHKLFREAPT